LEAVRAGIGGLVGLGVTGLFLLSPTVDLELGLFLVAPFGASSVLLFAVPNSPLAQPWSAVVGNTVAAAIGVAACLLIADPAVRIAVAVGGAITTTILCRAVHPPAGAVAMTAAMSPETVERLGFWFALTPIAVGTVALVVMAVIYARLTGRHYPFRHFEDKGSHGTADRDPSVRLGLAENELTEILERYRQSFNIGAEDLARMIGAAELQAAAHRTGPMTAKKIMSRDVVTITPDTGLDVVADLFKRHKFTSLPVVGASGRFQGIIFQLHLITQAGEDALRLDRTFTAAIKRLLDPRRKRSVTAGDIMNVAVPRATTSTPIGALLPMMADGQVDAVPVLEYDRLVGIVTQTDLVAAMARRALYGL
jgi:CBS domain-containing membrane protein